MQNWIGEKTLHILGGKNNFDIIRYYLSFAVFFAHFGILTNTNYFLPTSSVDAVHGFFVLSGFLVFLSYIRNPQVGHYANRRIRRILPPYFFIITCCFFLGGIISSLSFGEYITSTQTWKYLIANYTFLNFLEPALPGVFSNNVVPVINGSLWTLKVEVLLYASVPIVYFLMERYGKLSVFLFIFIFSVIYNEFFLFMYSNTQKEIFLILKRQVGGQLVYFYSGTFLLLYFNFFQKRALYFIILAMLVLWFRDDNIVCKYMEPLAFAVVLIGFAYNLQWFTFLRRYDNIAYGIYLFHFPVIQFVVWLGIDKINIHLALISSIVCTILISLVSWFLLEKPVLQKRLPSFKF